MLGRRRNIAISRTRDFPAGNDQTLYLLSRRDISDMRHSGFDALGVSIDNYLDTYFGAGAYAFTEKNLPEAMKRLSAYCTGIEDVELYGYEGPAKWVHIRRCPSFDDQAILAGLEEIDPTKPLSHDPCEVGEFDGHSSRWFAFLATRVLAQAINHRVRLNVPHGHTRRYREDLEGPFAIEVWSSPEGRRRDETPEYIWGVPVDCRDVCFEPTGQGITIEDDSGYAVAELFPSALYIHHDVVHRGTERELLIFRKILDAAAQLLAEYGSEDRGALVTNYARTRAESFASDIEALFERNYAAYAQTADQEFEACQTKVKELEAELRRESLRLRGIEVRQSVKADLTDHKAALAADIEAAKGFPQVATISLFGRRIHVHTHPVTMLHRGDNTQRDLGPLAIMINLADSTVTVQSQTPEYACHTIPHCDRAKTLQWGETGIDIVQYLAAYQISAVIDFVFQKLGVAHPDDPYGASINDFPVAKPIKKPKRAKSTKRIKKAA